MTISQTPILRDADDAKNQYRGFAMAQMRILKDYMRLGKLDNHSRIVTMSNGVVVTCRVCGTREDVFISIPPTAITKLQEQITATGFICHPRTGDITNILYMSEVPPAAAVIGGFAYDKDKKLQKTSTRYIYPLHAADPACCVIHYRENEQHIAVLGQKLEYGNFYLINPTDKTDVISWKGTPARQVPLNQLYHSIPGVDSTDEAIAFTPNIYKRGAIWLKGPECNEYHSALSGYKNKYGLILGCGYNGSTLLAVVKYDVKATMLTPTTVDFSKPFGTYISIWEHVGSWKELCRVKDNTYSYRPLPWSFSKDGFNAVNINGDRFVITKDDSGRSAEFIQFPINELAEGIEIRTGTTTSVTTGDGITEYSNVSEYHTTVEFNNQKEDIFFGYAKDDLLSMNVAIDDFLATDDKYTHSYNEYYDQKTESKCEWVTSGPIYMQCNEESCCNATLMFTSPNGTKECLPQGCTSDALSTLIEYSYSYQSVKTTTTSIPGSGIPDIVTIDRSIPITGKWTSSLQGGYWKCISMVCVGACQAATIQALPGLCASNIDPTPKSDAVCSGNTKTYIWGNTANAYYIVVTCGWVCL